MSEREQLAEAMIAAGFAHMPPWQARLFRQLVRAVAQGKLPRTIRLPPRGKLPAITAFSADSMPPRLKRSKRKPHRSRVRVLVDDPRQRNLPL